MNTTEYLIRVTAIRTGSTYYVGNTRYTPNLRGGFHGVLVHNDADGDTRGARRYSTWARAEQGVKAAKRQDSGVYTFEIVEVAR